VWLHLADNAAMTPAMTLALPTVAAERARGEEALVVRLRAQEPAALAEVYAAHASHVWAFARRFLGDDAAAEDMVQDTFVALGAAVRGFTGKASLRTFLVSIAVNRARHHVRAAARRRAAAARLGEVPRAATRTPEDELERVRLSELLSRALDELPLDQRVAFVLFEVEERTATEVATIVGANEATVRSRAFHARRKLRELLARQGL
jgi:RNA polymerase sigma-70 factor, ECF subfamily